MIRYSRGEPRSDIYAIPQSPDVSPATAPFTKESRILSDFIDQLF